MADVAAAAGVSGQTVSRVVNGSPRVDPGTRSRVETAMVRLGYRPHRAARALRTGRTQTIGLVVSTLATVGNSRMLQAVTDAAASRGYALTVVALGGPDAVADAFARLHDQGVDGAIVLNEATVFARDAGIPPGIAVVVVDSPPDGRFGIVQTDHATGARAATEYLLSRTHDGASPDVGHDGAVHDVVWHLGGPPASFAAAERERGWRLGLGARSAPPVLRGDWTASSGYDAALRLPVDATAVFAANDQMALGLLRGLFDAGRRVPDDVEVIGFDDIEDAAQYRPPLTTVRQDFDALGAEAVAMLVATIEGGRASSGALIATSLVVRESTRRRPGG
ncbi:LacI family DNA-binding transcriptional regulator [Microbacterium sp. P02]|uniref:LacI family DNA-binding transcriptional regulator n=1 Tax=Microbacterium sp. P02 TaxID=3366260 RepID=UPI003672A366